LYSAEALGKHGVNHTVNIKEYKRKVSTTENTFVFRPENFPDLEIVDTRF
jgi:anthranilate phosphoribosyltransferase